MKTANRFLLFLALSSLCFELSGQSVVSGSGNAAGTGSTAIYTVLPIPVPLEFSVNGLLFPCPPPYRGGPPFPPCVQPTGINNSGQVGGFVCPPGPYPPNNCQPFIATANSFQIVPLPAGFAFQNAFRNGTGINKWGQITGSIFDTSQFFLQPFIGTTSGSTVVPLSGGFSSASAFSINDSGQICGGGRMSRVMNERAFIGTMAGIMPVPIPSGTYPDWQNCDLEAESINNLGQIAGIADCGSRWVFFGDSGGIRGMVPVPGRPEFGPGDFERILQINDLGQIAGQIWYGGFGPPLRTFLTTTTAATATLIPLAPGCSCGGNPSLNNVGQIVGGGGPCDCDGWIWDAANGTRLLSDLTGSIITRVDGISDNGQIVAWAQGVGLVILFPDVTPPVIIPQITGTPGSSGWYKSDVTVSWSVTDTESGIASSTGCTPTTLMADTAGVTLTCKATNGVGLSSSVPVTIKIDKTLPVISGMPGAGCTLWPVNQKFVTVATVTASDALSGLVAGSFRVTGTSNQPIPPTDPRYPEMVISPIANGYTVQLRADRLGNAGDRVYTLSASANDLAGNTATVTATCSVPHDQGN